MALTKVQTEMAGTGAVLQVVNAIITTAVTTTSASYVTTGLTASITPKSNTSKILIMACCANLYNGGGAVPTTIYRNATNLGAGTLNNLGMWYAGTGQGNVYIQYLDSPATASATTYTVYFLANGGGTATFSNQNTPSTLVLMEIAG